MPFVLLFLLLVYVFSIYWIEPQIYSIGWFTPQLLTMVRARPDKVRGLSEAKINRVTKYQVLDFHHCFLR